MSAPLAVFKPDLSQCGAIYSHGTLKVSLTGEIPGAEFTPWIVREPHFVGGIKLILLAHWGGLGTKPPKTVTITYELAIVLPIGHGFQNKYVSIETAEETFEAEIKYTGFNPSNGAKTITEEPSSRVSSVLPPTDLYLPGGKPGRCTVTATAPIPPEGFTVLLQYKEEYLRIWDTKISDKTISWILTWEKEPKDLHMPVPFTVDTVFTGPIGFLPPGAQTSMIGTSHTYFVHVVLKGDASEN